MNHYSCVLVFLQKVLSDGALSLGPVDDFSMWSLFQTGFGVDRGVANGFTFPSFHACLLRACKKLGVRYELVGGWRGVCRYCLARNLGKNP